MVTLHHHLQECAEKNFSSLENLQAVMDLYSTNGSVYDYIRTLLFKNNMILHLYIFIIMYLLYIYILFHI